MNTDQRGREFRASLLQRAAELRERLQRVRSDLKRERAPLPANFDDAAIALENDEVLEAIELTATRELTLIDEALARIAHGVFGLCVKCAKEIDKQRLQAVPHASHCAACAGEG